jgi:hypothetical protein
MQFMVFLPNFILRRIKMKRTVIIMMAVLLVAGVFLATAEGKGWFQKGKAAAGKQMMGMCPMHKMACQGMMEKKLVALDDGSIVIMTCGKLYKYDKDLNLVKNVELTKIKEDAKARMEEMKKECMEMCPMMKIQEKSSDM